MQTRELTCINCPLGCGLTVTLNEKNEPIKVEGNSCKLGEIYGKKEVTDPRRVVTSTMKLEGGSYPTVSVKTLGDIPKNKIFDVMREINSHSTKAPVHIGDVLIENVAGTNVNIVATSERI
ncbi:MAG: DUF1667 domain-containing protein [Peptoniphilaceae bacterium]|nr:DUF1667 domain-containing protein [Peptoniphilaceae bacterium]MDD7383120.1 DUF1667 domain-containing protein [Peptoniphilaceae bacterium]MDY3738366.1 DUF1667 domain-containing protein [Peptoniphilaceae bacterium]